MNDDIRVSCSFPTHPKVLALEGDLGHEGPLRLIYLWIWAATYRPTGDLSGLATPMMERAVGWTGESGALIAALERHGLIEKDGAKLTIHDWRQHNAYAANSDWRRARAKAGADAKWDKIREKSGLLKHKSSIAESMAYASHVLVASIKHDAPTPSPTPSPTRKESNGTTADAVASLSPDELKNIPTNLRCQNCWRARAMQDGFCPRCAVLRAGKAHT